MDAWASRSHIHNITISTGWMQVWRNLILFICPQPSHSASNSTKAWYKTWSMCTSWSLIILVIINGCLFNYCSWYKAGKAHLRADRYVRVIGGWWSCTSGGLMWKSLGPVRALIRAVSPPAGCGLWVMGEPSLNQHLRPSLNNIIYVVRGMGVGEN